MDPVKMQQVTEELSEKLDLVQQRLSWITKTLLAMDQRMLSYDDMEAMVLRLEHITDTLEAREEKRAKRHSRRLRKATSEQLVSMGIDAGSKRHARTPHSGKSENQQLPFGSETQSEEPELADEDQEAMMPESTRASSRPSHPQQAEQHDPAAQAGNNENPFDKNQTPHVSGKVAQETQEKAAQDPLNDQKPSIERSKFASEETLRLPPETTASKTRGLKRSQSSADTRPKSKCPCKDKDNQDSEEAMKRTLAALERWKLSASQRDLKQREVNITVKDVVSRNSTQVASGGAHEAGGQSGEDDSSSDFDGDFWDQPIKEDPSAHEGVAGEKDKQRGDATSESSECLEHQEKTQDGGPRKTETEARSRSRTLADQPLLSPDQIDPYLRNSSGRAMTRRSGAGSGRSAPSGPHRGGSGRQRRRSGGTKGLKGPPEVAAKISVDPQDLSPRKGRMITLEWHQPKEQLPATKEKRRKERSGKKHRHKHRKSRARKIQSNRNHAREKNKGPGAQEAYSRDRRRLSAKLKQHIPPLTYRSSNDISAKKDAEEQQSRGAQTDRPSRSQHLHLPKAGIDYGSWIIDS